VLVSLGTLAFGLVEESHDAREVFSEVKGSYDDLDFIGEGVEGLRDVLELAGECREFIECTLDSVVVSGHLSME